LAGLRNPGGLREHIAPPDPTVGGGQEAPLLPLAVSVVHTLPRGTIHFQTSRIQIPKWQRRIWFDGGLPGAARGLIRHRPGISSCCFCPSCSPGYSSSKAGTGDPAVAPRASRYQAWGTSLLCWQLAFTTACMGSSLSFPQMHHPAFPGLHVGCSQEPRVKLCTTTA
jgi:hypothetical protein